jgi:hypothetical protein
MTNGRASFPQVVDQGGPILTAPQIVTVTFPGDSMESQLQSFGESLQSSAWWSTVTATYCEGSGGKCIGQGTAKSVVFGSAPAASYTDSEGGGPSSLRQWLASSISSGALPTPETGSAFEGNAPVSSSIYVLYFPATTTVMLDDLTSCLDFDGYHGSVVVGSQEVPYAVVTECSGPNAGNMPPITTLQNTTITASHEIIESTTDPSSQNIAYYLAFTDANLAWTDVQGGGEVADLCIDPFLLDQDETAEGAYTVQRIWSNAHAAAGLDPCNPIPSQEVYFNAAPEQSYYVLDVGSSVTIPVTAFSSGKRSNWTMTAQDWSDLASPNAPSYLGISIQGGMAAGEGESISVNNGQVVNVTVTLEKDPSSLPSTRADGSIITFSGSPSSPTAAHFWPFVVWTPAGAADAGYDASTSEKLGPPRSLRQTHVHRAPGFFAGGGRSPRSLLARLAGGT